MINVGWWSVWWAGVLVRLGYIVNGLSVGMVYYSSADW